MSVKARFNEAIGSSRLRTVLIVMHLALLAAVLMQDHVRSPDEATYRALARSMEQGRFTIWLDILDPAPPDVVRTHGYPAFLLLVSQVSGSVHAVYVAQALVYLGMLALVLLLLAQEGGRVVRRQNLFLLLMLPQFQVFYYVGQVFPETLMTFLNVWVALLALREPTRKRLLLLAMVLAISFWVRPVMLLLPLFILVGDLVLVRGAARWHRLRANALVLLVFLLLGPLPFTLWNIRAHGVASPVPLTGSALLTNLGFWQLRLPGYGTMYYFQYNTFGREIIPLVSEEAAEQYYLAHEEQWSRIDSTTRHSMTRLDSLQIPLMWIDTMYITRSAAYTVALDRTIAAENRRMIREEPLYYLGTRIYAAVRLWITNINLPMEKVVYTPTPGVRPKVGRPAGVKGWAKALLPFVITGTTFGIGLPLLARAVWRDRRRWFQRRYLLYLIVYVWLVHVPMVIQSRYTVPVHALAIACFAMMLVDRMERREEPGKG
jgi:hypothetical protein